MRRLATGRKCVSRPDLLSYNPCMTTLRDCHSLHQLHLPEQVSNTMNKLAVACQFLHKIAQDMDKSAILKNDGTG